MKAFVIDRYKPADGGHLADVPDPRPGPEQVLVEVRAAGVNPLDVLRLQPGPASTRFARLFSLETSGR